MSHDNVCILPNLLESLVGFCVGNLNMVLQSQWSLYRENSPLGPKSIIYDVTVERTPQTQKLTMFFFFFAKQ